MDEVTQFTREAVPAYLDEPCDRETHGLSPVGRLGFRNIFVISVSRPLPLCFRIVRKLTVKGDMSITPTWHEFLSHYHRYPEVGFHLDLSRVGWDRGFHERMQEKVAAAHIAMDALEQGAIANPDEDRMVGHYWLREPSLAPTAELREAISSTLTDIHTFADAVHAGRIVAANGQLFTEVLVIGIGGSALGPQLVADALSTSDDKMRVHFFDNTDPDGMDRVLEKIGGALATTMVLSISKSGGTKETRNGMLYAEAAFQSAGIPFASQAVAITGEGSLLDQHAVAEGWLKRFPMWDWVGGRTSVMSTVGLVMMALQGLDIDAFLRGAAEMDAVTRRHEAANPAMQIALAWWFCGDGKGRKDMVVLPYKDRLLLFSRYLQQLVMESLGKEKDLAGAIVHQGIAVYGNKGSTDQHAYVQQLRDGVHNFFVTFIEVAKGRAGADLEVEPGATSSDFLHGFLRGTRNALAETGRQSITITLPEVHAASLGALIALYDRAVGFYGSLVNVNAYHQPGVEAGKKAAAGVLALQQQVAGWLKSHGAAAATAETIAGAIGADIESTFHVLNHLAANGGAVVERAADPGADRFSAA